MHSAVYFEPNRGQAPSPIPFIARTAQGTVSVQPGRLTRPGGNAVILDGANRSARLEGDGLLPGVSSYALHRDPSEWIYDVPHYSSVLARTVYRGIDIRYHEYRGNIEFDLEIAAGGTASPVRLRFAGDIHISEAGDLITPGAVLHKPVAWQMTARGRQAVAADFVLRGRRVAGLRVGAHDPHLPMTVDPVIDFATFLGGSNNEIDTQVIADSSGAIYMAGSTYSADFPASPEPGTAASPPNPDVYVTRLKHDASAIDWSFFIGGSALNRCMGIAQDTLGHIYVFGVTTLADFPVTPGAWKTTINAGLNDEFVVELDAQTGHIVASTFLDLPPSNDGSASGPFAVDAAGDVFVASSIADSTFQPTPGAYRVTGQPSYEFRNPVLLRLKAGLASLVYATYIDLGTIVCLQADAFGNAVFAGSSPVNSTPFNPVNPISGVAQTANGPYIAKINASGTALIHASLLDGNSAREAEVEGLMLDAAGNIYVAGETSDPQFPQVNPLTLPSLPPNYPPPDGIWPSPFVALIPPQGGQYTQSTFLYGPQYTTPAGAPTSSWIQFAAIGGRVCLTGIGSPDLFVQTVGGLAGSPTPTALVQPLAGSSLACMDSGRTHFDTQTYLPFTGGSYTAVAPTPDGSLLFGGQTDGRFASTPGVVQPSFGGEDFVDAPYGVQAGDAFLFRVSLPNPVPHISFIYPDTVTLTNQTSTAMTFNVVGSGFASGAQATVSGQPASVMVYSSTQLSFSINPSALNPGANQVVVSLAGPGGGVSAPAVINAVNMSPGIITISPSQVTAGAPETQVFISGSNLSSLSVVWWGGVARPATPVANPAGGESLELTLEPAELAQPSGTTVIVTNPGPGGGVSAPKQFLVQAASGATGPVPVLNDPGLVTIASPPAATLLMDGSGLNATTQIYWDGARVPFIQSSATEIAVTPPAGSLAHPGIHTVYAANGSLVSATLTIDVAQTIPSTGVSAEAFDPVRQRLYLITQTTTGAVALVVYDTVSGAQLSAVSNLPVSPSTLAISDNGQFVYIAGGASGLEIARFNVATGMVDLDWQAALPPGDIGGMIETIFVATGAPKTLIVTLRCTTSGTHIGGVVQNIETQTVIYDDATPRPLTQLNKGLHLDILLDDELFTPLAVLATHDRIIFTNYSLNNVICWQWLDFDSFGIESGNAVCGSEPTELVHDHGVSYLAAGNRTLAISLSAGVSESNPPALLVDPVHRLAWSLNVFDYSGSLTTLDIDSLQQSVTPLDPGSTAATLFLAPSGPLMVTTNSFGPVGGVLRALRSPMTPPHRPFPDRLSEK